MKAALRSEILRNFGEYSAFSSDKVNLLTELDRFFANPSQYYNSDTVDLFLIALGNSYVCNTMVYRCTEKDTWTNNISNPEKHYTKTLYFAMTDKDHVHLVLNTDDQRVESERQDNRISPESDSDIEIAKYVPPPKAFEKTVNNQSVKFTVHDKISSDDGHDRLPIGHPIVNHPVFSLIPLNWLTCTIAFLARVRSTPRLCVVNPVKFL